MDRLSQGSDKVSKGELAADAEVPMKTDRYKRWDIAER